MYHIYLNLVFLLSYHIYWNLTHEKSVQMDLNDACTVSPFSCVINTPCRIKLKNMNLLYCKYTYMHMIFHKYLTDFWKIHPYSCVKKSPPRLEEKQSKPFIWYARIYTRGNYRKHGYVMGLGPKQEILFSHYILNFRNPKIIVPQ